MYFKFRQFITVLAVLGPLSWTANAAPLRYAFTGRVGAVSTEIPFGWNVTSGTPVRGELAYDPAVVGSPSIPNVSMNYLQSLSNGISLSVGDNSLFSSNYLVNVENSTNDGVSFLNFGPGSGTDQVIVNGATSNGRLLIGLVNLDGGTLTSTNLPASLNQSEFDILTGSISDVAKPNSSISLQIDSLRPIPEPAGGILALLAATGFVMRRRR